jgi:5'-nucleotidase
VSQISDGAGRFPQVAGLRFSFDRTIGPNSGRIKSVEVKAGDGWQPIEPDKLYLVASNDYMRAGGDGYAVLRDRAKNAYDYGPDLAVVLTTYLQAHRPYKPYTDGRIQDVTPKVVDSAKAAKTAPAESASSAAPKMPDLPPASMKLATEPPSVGVESAAAPTVATAAEPARAEPAPAQPVPAQAGGGTTHVVVAGDNFWKLAKALYGDPALWPKIAKANPALRARGLPVGATLKIPAK